MTPEILSYEAHVTIEPVFGERFECFGRLCALYGFRPAELLLQKRREDTPERSSKDSFATAHSKSFDAINLSTELLVSHLKQFGFIVWRYKIEGILLDVRPAH